jgi:hypothetical protein
MVVALRVAFFANFPQFQHDRGRDAGANWTFSGSNTVSVLANNGGVGVSGSPSSRR